MILVKAKTSLFMSAQPEFEVNNISYMEHTEKNKLTSSNILFYQFKTPLSKSSNLSAVPDGFLDILFSCDKKSPSSNLYGSVFEYKKVEVKPDTEYFGIRFLPADMIKGKKYVLKEIMDQIIPLEEAISMETHWNEKIAAEKNFFERIKLFKRNIGNQVFSSEVDQMQHALDFIYASKGNIHIRDLAVDMGFSERYMRKKFEDYIGMSPKLFSQIIKFQYSLLIMRNMKNRTIQDVIHEAGYYDQAHFTHTFKKFSHTTPGQFIDSFGNGSDLNELVCSM